ncbi:MAG: type I methionyl aminopeptidase [Omnitrophica WOR_2 bacterium GWF2_38_59]|nr:MAG: type I methionyl aminopeptidase [Omnitrophica WOR_2 bacterium GWA2_37_7]OGX25222.1 MAG: type I methionyl aminopeptidase [Omnitrophica WOR_2 bacterium GWF2_38_59]OGX47894.1 MAG: type I methionyl aminopeptidase [Omnitrophica WOR_2 bacterium RIFOXYA2_FULL_38_17]OGX54148.1 MAG: type I methionyl aminopeptidase [Omnitrophica WOR_2 bacterium RIFOXYA12_FULL_38_10]OGX56231.1 MAG: type I methionyl aminopeptidase [Omnitrophica WOR_2 bacterium RIFOXYC2_FULL_38_12]OGX60264.1 MAG: type I methionyl a
MDQGNKIGIKTGEELVLLREAGKRLSAIVKELKCSLKTGISTQEIDALAEILIKEYDVVPAFKGYRGFPSCVCVSINDEVVHGIPSKRKLENGDIVSLDVGIIYKGYYSDMAVTAGIGNIDPEFQRLIDVTKESLYRGIEQAKENNHLSDVSHAIQSYVEGNNYSVVREFVGHGIGKQLHEDPEIPNFGEPNNGPVLKSGMVLAIEPMVNIGDWRTKILNDGWTVVTKDGKPSAHFEHSIVVTKEKPEILTR